MDKSGQRRPPLMLLLIGNLRMSRDGEEVLA